MVGNSGRCLHSQKQKLCSFVRTRWGLKIETKLLKRIKKDEYVDSQELSWFLRIATMCTSNPNVHFSSRNQNMDQQCIINPECGTPTRANKNLFAGNKQPVYRLQWSQPEQNLPKRLKVALLQLGWVVPTETNSIPAYRISPIILYQPLLIAPINRSSWSQPIQCKLNMIVKTDFSSIGYEL